MRRVADATVCCLGWTRAARRLQRTRSAQRERSGSTGNIFNSRWRPVCPWASAAPSAVACLRFGRDRIEADIDDVIVKQRGRGRHRKHDRLLDMAEERVAVGADADRHDNELGRDRPHAGRSFLAPRRNAAARRPGQARRPVRPRRAPRRRPSSPCCRQRQSNSRAARTSCPGISPSSPTVSPGGRWSASTRRGEFPTPGQLTSVARRRPFACLPSTGRRARRGSRNTVDPSGGAAVAAAGAGAEQRR